MQSSNDVKKGCSSELLSNRIVVVYAADDNYAYLAGVSMLSLLCNCKADMDIYVLDDNISKENKQKLLSIAEQKEFKDNSRLFFIDMKSAIEDIKSKTNRSYGLVLDGHKSFTAYSRLYLSDLMPENINKVLYLDCDIVIAAQGIEELFNIAFENGKIMAAATDYANQEYKEWLGIPRQEKYYNSGVMLIDLEAWRSSQCSDIIFKHMTEHGCVGYPFADQDYINLCLRDKIQTIPLKYNVQTPNFMYPSYMSVKCAYNVNSKNYYRKYEYKTAVKNPVCIHYSGMAFIRPWYKNSNHPKKEKWLNYFYQSPWKDKDLNIWPKNKYIMVRELMYKLLPPSLNGFISGFFLRDAMRKAYRH